MEINNSDLAKEELQDAVLWAVERCGLMTEGQPSCCVPWIPAF